MRAGSVSFHTHTCTQTKRVPSRGSSTDKGVVIGNLGGFLPTGGGSAWKVGFWGWGWGQGVRLENRAVQTVSDFSR